MNIKVAGINTAGSASKGGLVLNGVTVVDTRTGNLTRNRAVLIVQGKIRRIVLAGTAQGGEVIEAEGKFLVPGFLDMHTHVLQQEHAVEASSALLLAHGVTGIRQMAGTTEMLRKRRNGTLSLGEHAPELLTLCGEILTPLNAATPEAGVAEVKRQKAEGTDFIKTIFVSPKTFFVTLDEANRQGLPYDGHMSPGVSLAEASRRGMAAIEHLGPTELTLIATSSKGWFINLLLKLRPPKSPDLSPEAMKAAGKIMIANPILGRLNTDPDALKKTKRLIDSYSDRKARELSATFVQYGTWQCPTLIRDATMRLGDDPMYTQSSALRYVDATKRTFWESVANMFLQKVSASDRDTLKRLGDMELKLTKSYDECGVKMMTGTDFGGGWVIPGISLHQEFDLLEQAGLTPLRVLQMTTLRGAEFLKRESTMGTVEEGKDANLVLLDRNPVESVANLHQIHAVVRAGSFYSGQALEEIKQQVAGRLVADEPDLHDAVDQSIP